MGTLYLVATPIGNLEDISARALRTLREARLIAAEDTRHTRQLLAHFDIHTPLTSYYEHNKLFKLDIILTALADGDVALVSDAGTPLVADPGYRLVVEAIAAGRRVVAAPGASALLAALAVAGLPTDRFLFAGFPPPKAAARARALAELAAIPATLVFYESPRRLAASLAAMAAAYGGGRPAAVCRELTKRFEEVRRGTLAALAADYAAAEPPKGEIVVVVGPPLPAEVGAAALEQALTAALAGMSVKDAAAQVAAALGLPRREVYARALALAR